MLGVPCAYAGRLGASGALARLEDGRRLCEGSAALIVYADTSALVKLVLQEAGSSEMRTFVGRLRLLACARIGYVELRAALAAANRDHRLREPAFSGAKARLERVWGATSPVELTPGLVQKASDLAELHALRGYDAVHLSAVQELGRPSKVDYVACWDSDLRRAAASLGYRLFPA